MLSSVRDALKLSLAVTSQAIYVNNHTQFVFNHLYVVVFYLLSVTLSPCSTRNQFVVSLVSETTFMFHSFASYGSLFITVSSPCYGFILFPFHIFHLFSIPVFLEAETQSWFSRPILGMKNKVYDWNKLVLCVMVFMFFSLPTFTFIFINYFSS